METRKLYYEDCHLQTFTATVTGCRQEKGGFAVTLDATAFYPEGGGQACDTGTLGGVRVCDVREKEGEILHFCDGPLPVGETVEGKIDYDRRFDLMQQHTGEHIVSGIIHKYFGYHNVGFHVGAEGMEVDFDGPIDAEALARIEREANEAVWANLPVVCWIPSQQELPGITYRTKRPLPWPVRIVQVGDVDSCACCGVHTARTGEVGIIKILSCAKFHQGVRLVMLCGRRATDWLCRVFEQNRQVSQAFSATMLQTGEAARRMNDTLAAQKLQFRQLQSRLFDRIAQDYRDFSGVAVHFEPELDGGGLRTLAEAIARVSGGTAAVFTENSAGGYDVCLCGPAEAVTPLGKAMGAKLSGRGGGKPGFYQGRVAAGREEICRFFRESLEN